MSTGITAQGGTDRLNRILRLYHSTRAEILCATGGGPTAKLRLIRESAGHGDLGDLPPSPHRQVEILTAPFWEAANCDLGRLRQQETQQRVALFRDMTQGATLSERRFNIN
jgi:hypothetical protein